MKKRNTVILAIESAICGGSLSLIVDGAEVANWIGSSNVSKAEDLLLNIDTMLTRANISRPGRDGNDIDVMPRNIGTR